MTNLSLLDFAGVAGKLFAKQHYFAVVRFNYV